MSAADDVTSGPDAQRPGAGGAVGADAMTLERAKLAWPERGLIRDRENIDDVKVRPRIGFVVEEDRVGYEHSVVVNADQQMLSRTRCLEIVREARELVRKTAPPSPATVVDYTAKSDRLLAACEQLSGDESSRWNQLLQPYAPKKNSFFPMRAAVAWRMREQIRTLLAEQCRMQRGSVPAMGWHHALTEIEIRIARLLAIEGVQRSELLEASGVKSVRAKSKRKDLHRFPADWPEQMIETSEWGAYGAAVWVLANTGCRPEELVRGVELRPECNHITVRINGAKVGESSGQLWRELDVAWGSVPQRLRDRLAEVETFVVRISSKTALGNAVSDSGRLLWPKGPRVCPYHLRHQVAEDLRAAGWTADEIGAALGHRVGETSSNYGRRIRVGQGGVARVPTVVRGGVRTAVPVRPTAVFDPAPLRAPQRRGSRPNKT